MKTRHSPRLNPRSPWYARIVILLVLASMLFSMPQLAPAAPSADTGTGPIKSVDAMAANMTAKANPNCAAPAPQLTSPANNGNTDPNNAPPIGVPNFQWAAAANAIYYEFQVGPSPSFNGAYDIYTYATTHTPRMVVIDNNFPAGVSIYWRVRSFDAINCASDWSTIFIFQRHWNTSPTLASPANGATLTFLEHPSFSWTPVPGANTYQLRISTDSTCPSSAAFQRYTSEVEYNVELRLAPGNYFWCVAPIDVGGVAGTLSAIHSFTLSDVAAPTPISPSNGVQLTFTPPFHWTAVKGAGHYQLLYSQDPHLANAIVINTAYTSYTPPNMFGNNTTWYWAVETIDPSQHATMPSQIFNFRITWALQARLLTPNNLYHHVTYPYFQWSGVADAREYELQVATDSNFPTGSIVVDFFTSATSYIAGPGVFIPDGQTNYYWRIISYGTDRNITKGATSGTFSFQYDPAVARGASTVPALFYPSYAYNPDPNFDRPITSSVATPIFQWQRVTSATNYLITIGSTINMTDTLLQATTTQPNFSPNLSDNGGAGFNFDPNTIYYWRVQYQINGVTQPSASQVWAVRVNPALDYTYQFNNGGWLQSPTDLQDYVNMDPIFRWYPYPQATHYTFQIATDVGFSNIVQTLNTNFAGTALRQQLPRNLYYWRVLAYNGNNLISTSTANRLHIFAPALYTTSDPINTLTGSTVATGTVTSSPYNISAVYATKTHDPANNNNSYKIGLSISAQTGTAVSYTIPINLDYALVDNNGQVTGPSGAPHDPVFTNISYSGEFQPEYVIKFDHNANGSWTNPMMRAWDQQSGGYDNTLIDIVASGGAFTTTSGYVEMSIPTGSVLAYRGNADLNVPTGDPTLVGMEPYSTDASGSVHGTVPNDPGATGGTPILSQFRSISDHPNLAYPFNTDFGGNGAGIPYALSVLYNSNLAWYTPEPTDMYGFDVDIAIDRGFTDQNLEYSPRIINGLPAFQFMFGGIAGGSNGGGFLPTYAGGTYFWRVRMCRGSGIPCQIPGSWSKPNRFNKVNIKINAPTVTINSGVPTFTWPRTEGAYFYEINVATDQGFTTPYDDSQTQNISYTPVNDYAGQQSYYYRLRASEFYYNSLSGANWITVTQPFQIAIPQPPNLGITDSSPVMHSPTFAWDTVLVPSNSPVIQASSYQLQTSRSNDFSQPLEVVNTVNLNWTPYNIGYMDGTYYYRVRTQLYNNNAWSDWTTPITFTKQYPLVNVSDGGAVPSGNCTYTFTWPAFDTTGNPSQPSGIFAYRLETASDVNFTHPIESVDTVNASYTNSGIGGCVYSPFSDLFWRVSMIDSYGNQGPYDIHTILGQPTPTVTGTPPTATPTWTPTSTWTPGGPTATNTPTNTPVGPTNTPTLTPTQFGATNTPTLTFTPGGPTTTPCSEPFTDVPQSYWAHQYITYVYCQGVVSGIGGNLFAPNATATRAQFSRMVVKARGLTIVTPGTPDFTDVPTNNFAYSYIETAKIAGIVSGYTQAQCQAANAQFPCFLPNAPVSRGAMAKFIVKAWGWPETTPTSGQLFTDVPTSSAFYIFIYTAKGRNIVDGETQAQCTAEGTAYPCYRPNDILTRAQLSKTLFRSMTYPN